MIGPSDGIAAVISTPALDTNLTLTCGQLTNDADNHASAATTANDASSQDTASRSITPIPPRKKLRSADDRLLNRASPVMIRISNPCQSYTQANNIRTAIRVICTASLRGSQGEVYELCRNATNLDWMFLSNHAHVLICIAQEPEVRLHEVAARVGITERAVQRIVADLEEGGYLSRKRKGRRNHYELHADRPFRHPVVAHRDVSLLLYLILGPGLPNRSDRAK